MKKLTVISILLIIFVLFSQAAFAGSENDDTDMAEIGEITEEIPSSEDLSEEDITSSEEAPEAPIEPDPVSIDEEVPAEEIPDETLEDICNQEEVVPVETPEDAATEKTDSTPGSQEYIVEEAPEEEDTPEVFDEEEYSVYDRVTACVIYHQAPEVNIRKFKIKAGEQDELAGWLSMHFDDFELIEENGYIVAVSFESNFIDEEDVSDEEDILPPAEDSERENNPIVSTVAIFEEKIVAPEEIETKKAECHISRSQTKTAEEKPCQEPNGSFIGTLILIIGLLRRILTAM